MTNKSSSKQHCLIGNIRPKSKLRKRANKENNNARKAIIMAERAAAQKSA